MVTNTGKINNLLGKRFGRLTVIEQAEPPNGVKRRVYWLCQCDCGNQKIIIGTSLSAGRTFSCGCLQKENTALGKYKKDNHLRAMKKLESYFRGRASYTKKESSLSIEDLEKLIFRNCFYCNKKSNNTIHLRDGTEIKYSGLDRMDSSKGYEFDNVAPCCIECNQAKSNMSIEEFSNHIKNIYLFFVLKNKIISEFVG